LNVCLIVVTFCYVRLCCCHALFICTFVRLLLLFCTFWLFTDVLFYVRLLFTFTLTFSVVFIVVYPFSVVIVTIAYDTFGLRCWLVYVLVLMLLFDIRLFALSVYVYVVIRSGFVRVWLICVYVRFTFVRCCYVYTVHVCAAFTLLLPHTLRCCSITFDSCCCCYSLLFIEMLLVTLPFTLLICCSLLFVVVYVVGYVGCRSLLFVCVLHLLLPLFVLRCTLRSPTFDLGSLFTFGPWYDVLFHVVVALLLLFVRRCCCCCCCCWFCDMICSFV
jgi:hypothetical protein